MNDKIKMLRQRLNGFAGAALIFSEPNRLYFTGFQASDGALFVTPKGAVFYTDSRYLQAANAALGEENVRNTENMYKELSSFFTETGIDTCAVENDRLTLSEFEALKERLPDIGFDVTSTLAREIDDIRGVKTGEELTRIKQAQCIAERGFDYILGEIKPGVSEREIQLSLDYFMLKNGADALSFDTIAVAGENSSKPHGVPGAYKIQKGDFVTLDFGAVVNGFHSDMTRTVLVGTPTLKQKEVYDTVLRAQQTCLAALKPALSCREADKLARDVIEKAGYGQCFGHAVGHGVGVEIHEAPNLSPRSKSVLKAGNVVTVEPGIYLPGEFGVRIEDMAYITETGCENLTASPKEMICL